MIFKTGLIVPPQRPETFVSWTGAGMPILSLDEIQRITGDPNRIHRRQLFKPDKWIGRQLNSDCNGWAAAGALSRARVLRGCSPIFLSGPCVYAQINGGRDAGSLLDKGMRALLENGTSPFDMVNPKIWRWQDIPQAAKNAMARFRAHECHRIDTEIELASALAIGFQCVIAVHVGGRYQSLDSRGVRGESRGPGNHAVGAQDVRVVDGELQFDETGSWGQSNGTNGYAWLTWDRTLRWTVQNHAFYAIRSSVDDPDAVNPPPINRSNIA